MPYPAPSITAATPQPHIILEVAEPPTAQPRYMARKVIAVVVIIACVVIIVALMKRGREPVTDNAAAAVLDAGPTTADAAEKSVAQRAADFLNKGLPKQAVDLLKEHASEIEEDAEAQLQLGHAQAALRANEQALEAYKKALGIDANLQSDGKMNANLKAMLDDKSRLSVDVAALMYQQLGVEEAAEWILTWASNGQREQMRHRAVTVAESLGMGDRIDLVSSLILDLDQSNDCKTRRSIVPRLRSLGDPRAIPELRKAKARRNNACLRKDADEAIQYLESLARDAGSPPKG
jgi:tetratricopeptide (TPR) repeat protein